MDFLGKFENYVFWAFTTVAAGVIWLIRRVFTN